jgi:hypothetical protein
MTSQVAPRPPASEIREHIAAWLRAHADVAVRLLAAPPGYGKSTAIGAAQAAPGRRRVVIALDARLTADAFAARLREAFAQRPVDIVIDDAQLASPAVNSALNTALTTAPAGAFFLVATQRRDAIDTGTLFARGRLAVCDQSDFALDAADASAMFGELGCPTPLDDLETLVARCDGWPAAVAGTAREVAGGAPTIAAAFDRWLTRFHLAALDLIDTLLARAPENERAAARSYFAGGAVPGQPTLAVLHRCGFFVRFSAGRFAFMRWIEEVGALSVDPGPSTATLDFELFGRFTATIGGVPIVWARRRDQQILKYLLLAADHSATRAELADVFWPQTARPLALQNLRTACSTIRRAIGNVAGIDNVDRYLFAGERLALIRATVSCDVDRFRRLIARADDASAAGTPADAVAPLRAAERLYRNGLFAGDGAEPAFASVTSELAAQYAHVLARLSAALLERGSPDLAREYAAKAVKLRPPSAGMRGPHVHLRFAAS